MFEELNKRRQAVADNIAKSFENDIEKALGAGYDPEGSDGDNVEKARHGVYGDTAQNRRLNRVGQEYGSKKKEEAPSGKKQSSEKKEDGGSNKLSQSAAKASDKALERASKDPKASAEVKSAADAELKKRGGSSDENFPKLIVDNALNPEHPAVKTGLAREMTEWNIKDHYPNRITDAEKSQGFVNIFQKYLKSGKINENALKDYLMQYMGEGEAYKLLSIAEKNSGEEDGEFTKKYNAYIEECYKKTFCN